jgi:hypothetical protein
MPIDRNAAITYAKKLWNKGCDDEKIAISSGWLNVADKRKEMKAPIAEGWEVFFVANKATPETGVFRRTVDGKMEQKPHVVVSNDDLDDCTHYVSRCLVNEGIKLKETFRANELITALIDADSTKVLAERVARDDGQKIVDSGIFKPGDVIGFFNKSKGDRYSHSAMFTGAATSTPGVVGGLTCHSDCRFGGLTKAWNDDAGDGWFLYDKEGQSYTLIHFSEDDAVLMPSTMKWLAGWWKVDDRFYLIQESGSAKSTTRKPRSAGETLHGDSRAYLFQGKGQITFIWRSLHGGGSIRVETWAAGINEQSSVKVQIDSDKFDARPVF